MRVRILAVGQHIADWAQEAVRGYLARFPRSWSVECFYFVHFLNSSFS